MEINKVLDLKGVEQAGFFPSLFLCNSGYYDIKINTEVFQFSTCL